MVVNDNSVTNKKVYRLSTLHHKVTKKKIQLKEISPTFKTHPITSKPKREGKSRNKHKQN